MKRKLILGGALAAVLLVSAVGAGVRYGTQPAPQQTAVADFSPLPYSDVELEFMSGEEFVAVLTPLAEAGRVQAMTRLGWAYVQRHNGLICDWGEVQKWFCRAADLGDAEALSAIAMTPELFDCDPQGKYLRRWLAVTETAAQNGDADAMWELAEVYEVPRGHTRAQHERAAYWRKKAVEAGQEEAVQAHLRDRVEECLSKDELDADDTRFLRQALMLENSNITAVAEGICYEKGIDRPADGDKAVQCYENATNICAKKHLAELYEEGRGVKQDLEKALNLYEEAGTAFDIARCAERLRMQAAGQGAEEAAILAEAAHNPFVAARTACEEQLNKPAQPTAALGAAYNALAEMYALGRGGKADLAEAVRLNKTAEKLPTGGHSAPAAPCIPAGEVPDHAVCRLLNDILTGEVELLPQQLAEAERRQFTALCRREALLGCADAQYKLSHAYRTGYGDVPADEEMADRWLGAAAQADFLPALVEEATKKDESNIPEYGMTALYGQEAAMKQLQAFMQGRDADFATDSVTRHAYFFALADAERGDWYHELYCLWEKPQGVNAALPHGTTPLKLAFRFGRPNRVIALMAAGAALPTEQAWLNAELERALRLGRTEAAQILLAAGGKSAAATDIPPMPTTETWLIQQTEPLATEIVRTLETVRDKASANLAAEKLASPLRRLEIWISFAESYARGGCESEAFAEKIIARPAFLQLQEQSERCRQANFFDSDALKGVVAAAERRKGTNACKMFEVLHTMSECNKATSMLPALHNISKPRRQTRAYLPAMRVVLADILENLAELYAYAEPTDAELSAETLQAARQESAQTTRACLPLWEQGADVDAEWGRVMKALAPLLPQGDFAFRKAQREESGFWSRLTRWLPW